MTGYQDHPSVKSWSIEADGSVKIPEASILASSDRYPDHLFAQLEEESLPVEGPSPPEEETEEEHQDSSNSVVAKFSSAMSNPQTAACKLWEYLTDEEGPPEEEWKPPLAKRVAIVLATGPGGVVVAGLQNLKDHESGEPRWIRIFIHSIGGLLSVPEPEPLHMVVL